MQGRGAGDLVNGTGGLQGTVIDDIGVPVGGATVSLIGTPFAARTNASGGFRIMDLEPFAYDIRITHPSYQALESSLDIEEGQIITIEVIMLPLGDAGAGYRPHFHDYWAGRDRVTVMDASWDWNEAYDRNRPYVGHPAVSPIYNMAVQAILPTCIFDDSAHFTSRDVWFEEESQLVWAGTKAIEVTPSWSTQDFAGTEVQFAWLSADASVWAASPPLANGETFTIELNYTMADSSHQAYTLWRFAVCNSESVLDGVGGFPFVGDIHVKMDLINGLGIPPEPAHPRFWDNGTEYTVVDDVRGMPAQYSTYHYGSNRGGFAIVPEPPQIVPPGTAQLRIRVEWDYATETLATPWSVMYRPADVNPFQATDNG
ncbi:MAG: carboxypeptidase regulatory-like domain-containing protein, partial [Acidimicrobiia bacterium]|nr:carboxypeptidase regulatory-like domain-containing protein [Acidimicrobiia bacterium]